MVHISGSGRRDKAAMSGIGRKVYGIAAGGVFFLAVFMGLWFMGIFSFGEKDRQEMEAAGQREDETPVWEIIFKGMKLTIPEKGKACVHESGCMNVRQQEDYLLQIDIEEDTLEQMWGNMDRKKASLIDFGYRVEKEPEWLEMGEQAYVRYVISIEGERGSDYDRSYFEVMLTSADEGRHFLAVARYDGIDLDNFSEEIRDNMYQEAMNATVDILEGAVPTDEKDDEAGTFWMADENIDPDQSYLSEDSLSYDDGKWTLTYRLPENSQIISDNVAGKTYLDTDNRIYTQVSVVNYAWQTAEEKSQKLADSELSRIHTQGELEVKGRTFYYYTYSVLEYGKKKKEMHYYFRAFCDLENDDIYTIYAHADNCPMTLDEMYYLDVMDITESNMPMAETPQ